MKLLYDNGMVHQDIANVTPHNRLAGHHNAIAARYIASALPVRRIAIAPIPSAFFALKNDAPSILIAGSDYVSNAAAVKNWGYNGGGGAWRKQKERSMAQDAAYWEAERRVEAARRSRATELRLRDMELTEVPESIAALTQLQTLKLYGNELTTLPESIAALTQLQTLDLSENQLTTLPESIATLTQLQTLDLESNPLNPDLAAAAEQGTEAILQYLRTQAEE